MARVESNADEVAAWIAAVVDGFDYLAPGEDQSLGRDLVGIAAQGIIDRSVPGAQSPDGSTWAANEPDYAAWKRRRFDADQPGILSGQMLSLESMVGTPAISPDHIEMTYGTGTGPTRSRSGAPLSASQRAATDREKAGWFADSGREFYDLDATIEAALVAHAGEALARYIDREGG